MEAEQTAWLASNGVPTTVSDGKYNWHTAPEAKVRPVSAPYRLSCFITTPSACCTNWFCTVK
jgi:hypothetical protein